MLRNAVATLALVTAALALPVAPANADPEPGVLSLYEGSNFTGREIHIVAGEITATCTPLKAPLVSALSAQNFTTKAVALYTTLANCQSDMRDCEALPGMTKNCDDPVLFYKQVPLLNSITESAISDKHGLSENLEETKSSKVAMN